MKQHTSLLRTSLMGLLFATSLHSFGQSAKEENPGYLFGGLNYHTTGTRYGMATTGAPGFIFGLGSEMYFGGYVAEKLRFGLNMGWFSLAGNFYTGGGIVGEIQAIKPGFLFSANLTESARLDFKYSAMPTLRYYGNPNSNYSDGAFGVAHGPYFGAKLNTFTVGLEYVLGNLRSTDDWGSRYSYLYSRYPANTFRFVVGYNW